MESYLKKFGIEFKNKKIKLPKWCKRLKIDIGLSENAPQTKVWLENQSDLIVFGFEPVKDNFKKILRGTSKWTNKLNPANIGKRVYIINCALGNVEAPLKKKIYVTTKDKGCSSIYRPKYPKILKTENVDVFSLDNFTELLPLDDFEFIEHIKSDCQGSDFDILKKANSTLLKTAVYTIETEDKQYYNTNNNIASVSKFFKKKNFLRYSCVKKLFYFRYFKNFSVVDPTFYNKKFFHKFIKKNIFIYQKG
jgi:FkbM family methyltransferase